MNKKVDFLIALNSIKENFDINDINDYKELLDIYSRINYSKEADEDILSFFKEIVSSIVLKQLENFNDYFISDTGKIYSKRRGKLKELKPWLDGKKNYLMITLCGEQGHKKELIHRLVAQAFIPNPNGYTEVNHINYIKLTLITNAKREINNITKIHHHHPRQEYKVNENTR